MNAFVAGIKHLVAFVLSCFDRVVITGTLPDIAYPDAMARFLGARAIRLFDFPQWAETVRDAIRRDIERLAAAAGLEIESPALNIPLDQLERRLGEIPHDREAVAYCRGPWCVLSFEIVARLRAAGRSARRLDDGWPEWRKAGLRAARD